MLRLPTRHTFRHTLLTLAVDRTDIFLLSLFHCPRCRLLHTHLRARARQLTLLQAWLRQCTTVHLIRLLRITPPFNPADHIIARRIATRHLIRTALTTPILTKAALTTPLLMQAHRITTSPMARHHTATHLITPLTPLPL